VRVVVVDDSASAREALAALLADIGGIVVAGGAGSGDEALARLGDLKPDLVIMDWSMPGMDGVETTARIRREHPGTRVVGWTATDEPALRDAFVDAGAMAVFLKEDVGPLLRYLAGLAVAS
jgi:DNA-binding NarL/FixJ family response regulator